MCNKIRSTIPYGYTVNKIIMRDSAVDSYNATQLRINKFIESNMPVPEYELHDSWARINIYFLP